MVVQERRLRNTAVSLRSDPYPWNHRGAKPYVRTRTAQFAPRGAGTRGRSQVEDGAIQSSYDDATFEFIHAINDAKVAKGCPLAWSEVYEVVVGILGYRRPEQEPNNDPQDQERLEGRE